MKKIILLLAIFFGITFSANAQSDNTEAYSAAKAEINRISSYFELSNEQIDDLMPILVKKHDAIINSTDDNATKNEIRMRFATLTLEKLDENAVAKIEGSKELYNEIFGIEY